MPKTLRASSGLVGLPASPTSMVAISTPSRIAQRDVVAVLEPGGELARSRRALIGIGQTTPEGSRMSASTAVVVAAR